MKKKEITIVTTIAALVATMGIFGLYHLRDTPEEDNTYTVGIAQFTESDSLNLCREGIVRSLSLEGFAVDDNLVVELSNAQGDLELLTQITSEYVDNSVDLIVAVGTPVSEEIFSHVLEAGIPVVFATESDLLEDGLVGSDGMPLTEITGISMGTSIEEQVSLVREVLPEASKLGLIYDEGNISLRDTLEAYKEEAKTFGFELVVKGITKSSQITEATNELLKNVDAVTTMTDMLIIEELGTIVELANEKSVPVFCSQNEQVKTGCIAAKGIDYLGAGISAGVMVSEILKGEKSASMIPFEIVEEGSLSINNPVASKLGITLKESLVESSGMVYQEIVIG